VTCPADCPWYAEAQRLNSLAAHHAGNRAMQDVEIGQLRAERDAAVIACEMAWASNREREARIAAVREVCEHLRSLKPGHDVAWQTLIDITDRVLEVLDGPAEEASE
jgi:hypothetical protein